MSTKPPVISPQAQVIACVALTFFLCAPGTLGQNAPVQRQGQDAPEVLCILGAVRMPGCYHLKPGERETILKVLQICGGLAETADKGHSHVIRHGNGSGSRIEIHVNLNELLRGKPVDVELVDGDVLYVPALRKPGVPHQYDPYYDPRPPTVDPPFPAVDAGLLRFSSKAWPYTPDFGKFAQAAPARPLRGTPPFGSARLPPRQTAPQPQQERT